MLENNGNCKEKQITEKSNISFPQIYVRVTAIFYLKNDIKNNFYRKRCQNNNLYPIPTALFFLIVVASKIFIKLSCIIIVFVIYFDIDRTFSITAVASGSVFAEEAFLLPNSNPPKQTFMNNKSFP